jgi:hypothetical protein
MLTMLLFGCGKIEIPVCVETGRTPVADDEATATSFSVNDVLAWSAGEFPAYGLYEDDSTVDVVVTHARGEGTAELVTSEAGVETRPSADILFGTEHLDIAVRCPASVLTWPTTLSARTADDRIDVSMDMVATAESSDRVSVAGDVPADDVVGLPLPEGDAIDGRCESGDPDHAFVQGTWEESGIFEGEAGWEGDGECSDGSSASWARYTLTWGSEQPTND